MPGLRLAISVWSSSFHYPHHYTPAMPDIPTPSSLHSSIAFRHAYWFTGQFSAHRPFITLILSFVCFAAMPIYATITLSCLSLLFTLLFS